MECASGGKLDTPLKAAAHRAQTTKRRAQLDDNPNGSLRDIAGNDPDALLDSLAAGGYLNETRFVESRVHQRASRFGVQRIQQELAQHGLKLDAEQQDALRASELERAREVWLKRFGPEPAREPTEQARQTRFLLARGFSPDLVRRLLRAQGSLD